jgi:gliding motility-associated-like protein
MVHFFTRPLQHGKACSSILLLLIANVCSAQLQNTNWVFGYGARVDFSGPVPVTGSAPISSNEATAIVSDPATGELLFYTDGRRVWNANDQVMPNGDGLLGGVFNSCTQGALIVPFPCDDERYYLFTLDELEVDPADPVADDGLRYSVVDMTLDGGLGDVVTSTINTPLATDLTEKLIVIRSTEIEGFWVIAHRRNDNEFLAWQIDASGVDPQPVVSEVGSDFVEGAFGTLEGWMGAMDASPDGTRIGMPIDWSTRLEFFDFDKATGVVSGLVTVNVTDDSTPPFIRKYGACFSPDGSRFYYTTMFSVYQLDLSTYTPAAIEASNTFIYSPSAETDGNGPFLIEQAPNDRLYVAIGNLGRLDEIADPNALGLGCGYVNNAVDLSPALCQLGLPAQVPLGGFCDPEPCPAVTVTAGQTNATCNGAADGSATVVASGGTTFTYAWSPIGGTSATAAGLPAGSYTCTITNECGNSTTQSFSITEPDGYRLNATVVQPTCGSNNGCISFAPAPAGTYFYSWPFPTNMVVDSVCDLAPGAYTILINSENGCPTDTTIVLADVPCGNTGVTLPNIFTPNGDGVNDRFAAFEPNPGNWQLTIYSRWGTEVFSTNNLIQGWSGKDASAGTYYWVLQPQAGQQGERRAGHVTLLVD